MAQPLQMEALTIENGLSQGMIFDILKDSDGFLWFATKNGLNRYDGYNFKVFTHNPFDSLSISGDKVFKLLEDSKGRIWVGTEGKGLNYYDKATRKFHRIADETIATLATFQNSIYAIEEDEKGRIWAGGADGFLISIEDKSNSDFKIEIHDTKPYNLSDKIIYTIKSIKNGGLLVAAEDSGLYQWNEKTNTIKRFALSKEIDKETITNIIETPNDTWWLVSLNNLYRIKDDTIEQLPTPQAVQKQFDPNRYNKIIAAYNNTTQKIWITYLITPNLYEIDITKTSLEAKSILRFEDNIYVPSMLIDENRIAWFGTNGYGIRKMRLNSYAFKHLLPQKSIWSVHQTKEGGLFVSHNKKIMEVLQKDQIAFVPITSISNLPIKEIAGIVEDNHSIWAVERGIPTKLFQLDTLFNVTNTFSIPSTYLQNGKFHQDAQGNLWFCSRPNGLIKKNVNTGKNSSFPLPINNEKQFEAYHWVNDFYKDQQDIFWVSTDNGLLKATISNQGKTVDYEQYINNPNDIKSINNNVVAAVIDDPTSPDEILWIATKGGGLNKMNKRTGTFEHFTTEDGLPDNVVYAILPDNEGYLWLSTNRGLSKYNPKNNTFINFKKSDGLQDDEFNTGAYSKHEQTGDLFFGGINGITAFYPKDIKLSNYVPNVYIVGLKIHQETVEVGKKLKGNGKNPLQKPIEFTQKLKLAWHQNHIELEFAALDYMLSNKNLYQYQLVGVDKNWVQAGNNRIANYANLAPGTYTFQVKGSNSSGLWSETVTTLEIVIYPPWWRTKLAYIFYTLLILSLLYTIYRFQINRIRLKSDLIFKEKEAMRLAELDTIKTNFFSNITHEFRTPLTLIIEPLRQLIQDYPKTLWIDKVKLAKTNSEKLLGLINQLLDLSKLESEKMQLTLKSGNILNVIQPIVHSFQLLAQQKAIDLQFDAPDTLPNFDFDKEKIEKVLYNLLSNAVKFTPQNGQIKVVVNNTPQVLSIIVEDNGIGISVTEQANIFDRFYQIDNSTTRQQQGTGIGLALSKELVRVMNGDLSVESELGKGSRFKVVLPIIINENNHTFSTIPFTPIESIITVKSTINTPININTEANNLILLIEDNDELRAFIKTSIADNYQIIEADNGKTGIDLAMEYIPNLIISDVMMPEVNGFDACQILKTDSKTAHIPVILLTAKTTLDSKIQGLKHGADAYMTKPFSTKELVVRIENLLENRRKVQQKYTQILESKTTTQTPITITQAPTDLSTYDQDFINNIYKIVQNHLDDESLNVEALAKTAAMSRVQLYRKTKALLNQTPTQFINNIRLKAAYHLLQQKKGNVTEIAFMVGFSSQKYFSTKFKEKYKISPREVSDLPT